MAAFDIDILLSAVKSAIDAASSLSTINAKVVVGPMKEGLARPYCSVNIVGDNHTGLFGGGSINYCPIEFSVYADTESQANSIITSVVTLLDRCNLSLSGSQIFMGAKTKVNPKVKQEGRIPTNRVYKATATIEFMVQV